jgi:hypothetical protein
LNLLIPVVVVGALFPALQAGWFWDDIRLILFNPVVQGLDWEHALTKHLWWGMTGDSPEGLVYYRPLVLCSFLVDRLLGGELWLAHLHSLVWHLAAVVGVQQWVAREKGPWKGALAALLFGLHPAAVEAAVWVSARNDPMALAFSVWALYWGGPVGGVLAFLACLCKESGFFLPVFAFCLGQGFKKEIAAGVSVALLLRVILGIPSPAMPDSFEGVGVALLRLLGQVVVPWPLTSVEWVPAQSLPGWLLGVAIGVVLGWGFIARELWKKGAYFTGLIPVFALLPGLVPIASTGLSGERFLYMALALGVIVGARVLDSWRWAMPVLIGWLVVLGLRLGEWGSEESLLRAAMERSPSSLVAARLGMVLESQGRGVEALESYRLGLELRPVFTRACGRPVELLEKEGRGEEVERWRQEFREVCGER